MPADIYTVNRTKDLIISFIRARGPSLPVHIARDVKLSPLFASAFLSELYGEGKVKMSALKVGSSSLYYLTDQVAQLENFIDHLNVREKEAYTYLKQEKILDDEKLEPVTRVALRSLKDFAFPIRFTQDSQPKLFWRHFLVPEEDAQRLIATLLEPMPKKEAHTLAQNTLQSSPQAPQKAPEPVSPTPKARLKAPRTKHPDTPSLPIITLPLPKLAQETEKEKSQSKFAFTASVKEFLKKKEIQLLEIKTETKKELAATIALDTLLGPQRFLLVAKDKKRVKGEELLHALQQAHAEKLPAFFLAPGELEKKALPLLAEWSALLKFEKLV